MNLLRWLVRHPAHAALKWKYAHLVKKKEFHIVIAHWWCGKITLLWTNYKVDSIFVMSEWIRGRFTLKDTFNEIFSLICIYFRSHHSLNAKEMMLKRERKITNQSTCLIVSISHAMRNLSLYKLLKWPGNGVEKKKFFHISYNYSMKYATIKHINKLYH